MDKTFCESQGAQAFDWNLFLANPPLTGSAEHNKASMMAHDWVTCGCGNQCAIIPRDQFGAPDDVELCGLGARFLPDIFFGEWEIARATLAAIEARSAVLIQQELAKLNP